MYAHSALCCQSTLHQPLPSKAFETKLRLLRKIGQKEQNAEHALLVKTSILARDEILGWRK